MCVIAMSDQMPFWVKLRPGKQLFHKSELVDKSKKKPLTDFEKELVLGSFGGGGSQKPQVSLDDVFSQKLENDIETDGVTMLKGESHGNQDKFRITVDLEQVVYGYWSDKDPVMDWGITSVTFTGSHFNAQNADENRHYLWDEHYWVSGKEVFHKAGTPIQHGLGAALLNFRDENPEMWNRAQELKMRFYQQPAGFEDATICQMKHQEQGKTYPCSISLKDMFTGGLSEAARREAANRQQLLAWIRAKVTALIQLADTHVIRQTKLIKLQQDMVLRSELAKLADMEGTRSVFHCGFYEIMRTLIVTIEKTKEKMLAENTLMRGAYQNGWLSLRPNLLTGKMERTSEQAWTQNLKLGSHRLPQKWFEERISLDAEGRPKLPEVAQDLVVNKIDEEQSYSAEPGETRNLKIWEQMAKTGDLTEKDWDEIKEVPCFEMEVSDFIGLEGLEDYKDWLKTPGQLRKEKGIDPKLTTQKQDKSKQAQKRKARELEKEARKPLRTQAIEDMKKMKDEGYSLAQISASLVIPTVGKGKNAQGKKLRDAMAKKLAQKKKDDKEKKEKDEKETEEKPEA
jgi:hypothetical protein